MMQKQYGTTAIKHSAFFHLILTLCITTNTSSVFAEPARCSSLIDGYVKGSSTAQFVQSCLGEPNHKDHNPDGRFVYLYRFDDLVTTFLFDDSGVLIRSNSFRKKSSNTKQEKISKNQSESFPSIITIYSQKITFKMPRSWKVGFEDKKANSYLIEFIPKKEKIKSWHNILSIQGFKNLSSKVPPEAFLDSLAQGMKLDCPKALVYEKLGLIKVDGYDTFTAILGCAELPNSHETGVKKGQSEIGFYFSIRGKHDYYLIHKSVRGESFSPDNSPINKTNVGSFVSEFFPIGLCKGGGKESECIKEKL